MTPRWAALPVSAVIAVGAVLGAQLAHGGGRYEPLTSAPACQEKPITGRVDTIDALTERLVLIGLADAACDLGISREQLALDLAEQTSISDAQVEALRAGLLSAVQHLESDGTLPRASDLVDEAIENADLNPLIKRGIGLLPAGVVDAAVDLDDVLTRAIESLDLRDLLSNLDDQDRIERAVEQAITQAVQDSLTARVRDLLP